MGKFKVALAICIALLSVTVAGTQESLATPATASIFGQAPLLEFAGPLQDQAVDRAFFSRGTAEDSGFAGVSVDPERMRIDLYWKGRLSGLAMSLASKLPSSVDLRIHEAEFSLIEEANAIEMLQSYPTSEYELQNVDVVPSDSGHGLRLESHEGAFTSGIVEALRFVDFHSDLPIVDVGFPAGGELTSRTFDASPFSGGSLIFMRTNGYCSSGVNVTSPTTGVDYVLTAQHCFHDYYVANSPNEPVYNGYANGTAREIGTWKSLPGYNFLDYDAALYRPTLGSTQAAIYVGGSASSSKYTISSVYNPIKGQTVCTDGARSGEHCGVVVDDIYFAWKVSYDDGTDASFKNIVSATTKGTSIAVATGDSGGPVYDYQNGGYAAVGIITGGFDIFDTCNVSVETCYSSVAFSSVYRDLKALGMVIKK